MIVLSETEHHSQKREMVSNLAKRCCTFLLAILGIDPAQYKRRLCVIIIQLTNEVL